MIEQVKSDQFNREIVNSREIGFKLPVVVSSTHTPLRLDWSDSSVASWVAKNWHKAYYEREASLSFRLPVAAASPSLFFLNEDFFFSFFLFFVVKKYKKCDGLMIFILMGNQRSLAARREGGSC